MRSVFDLWVIPIVALAAIAMTASSFFAYPSAKKFEFEVTLKPQACPGDRGGSIRDERK